MEEATEKKQDSRFLLEVKHLHTYFTSRRGIIKAVNDTSYAVRPGETLGIVGESGSGKSVSAMSIIRLLDGNGYIDSGEVWFKGRDLTKISMNEMYNVRGNEISVIFQEPMTSLNPVYTIGKQVVEAVRQHRKDISKEEAKKMTIEMFQKVGIPEPEKRFYTYPHQLSGGLRQRVMIAMAMICDPTLMIADEPTTALDVTIEAQILFLMKQLQKERGTAIMMITHNLGVVAESCDFVYVMYAGKIMEQANIFELFRNPTHPYTFGLLNSIPKVTETKEHLYTIKGLVPNLLNLPQGCRFCTRCDKAMKVCTMYEPDMYEVSPGHKVRCFLANKEVMNSGK